MGCLRRAGCLLVVAAIAVALWITQDKWLRIVRRDKAQVQASADGEWQPLDPNAAARGRRALESLSSARGPASASLSASEIASYVVEAAGAAFPSSADSVEAAVIGDVLYVRAVVPTKDIAGSGVLGPLAGLLNARERITLGGSFHVVRPGLSEFELRDARLRDFRVPRPALPRLVQAITKGRTTEGVSDNALPISTPPELADVRIADGRVTLYRMAPGGGAP